MEIKLADLCAQANYMKICDEISDIKCDEGGINSGKLWQLKKKLSPRCRDPPTAMMDLDGKLNRLRNRDIAILKLVNRKKK